MEKSKRIEAINGELPEETIQHIQSYLSGKEAAQTTILSKSWYKAWLTRPNLDLDEKDSETLLPFPYNDMAFLKYAKKTMQRYEELNRKIQSASLSMNLYESNNSCMAKELIVKAMKLGATDLYIRIWWLSSFVLPHEVLESETLVRLSLSYCTIDPKQKVSCSRLKSLKLSGVCVEGNIISMCPLIEELVLSHYKGSNGYSTSTFRKLILKSVLGVNTFSRLKVLSLKDVEIGEWLFHDFSSKFPCLKKLTLFACTGYEKIQICSNSLECIIFFHRTKLRVKLDVPRTRKFRFHSSCVPSLSLETISRKWEFDISFVCTVNSSWFVDLREFLLELSSSKINLDLHIKCLAEEYDYGGNSILPKPSIVEELTIHINAPSLVYSAVLEDLFWTCRPNFIVLYLGPHFSSNKNNDFTKFVCDTLIKEGDENRNMSALLDLEEVNVELFEKDDFGGWQSLPCKTFLDPWVYSTSTTWIRVCLQLKWGETI